MSSIPQDMETILHIGAGEGHELEAYLNSNAKRIVLVEPSPTLAESLRQRARADQRVEVQELAVNSHPELNQLSEYNLPEAASLHEPTGLRSLYPGLQRRASHTVAVLSPETLVTRLELGKGPNLLVIQAPGAEQAIIDALKEHGQLKPFEHIWVTVPEQAYYASGSRAEAVLGALETAGYTYQAGESENPEWPLWILCRHPLAESTEALEAKIEALEANEQKLMAELESSKTQAADASSQLSELQARFDSTERKLNDTLEKLNLASESKQRMEQALEQYTQWCNAQKEKAEALAAKSEALEAKEQQLASDLDSVKAEASTALDDKKALQARIESTAKELEQAQQQLASANEAKQQLEQELEQRTQWHTGRKKEAESLKQELDAERAAHKETSEKLKETNGWLVSRKKQLSEAEEKVQQLEQLNATDRKEAEQREHKLQEQLDGQRAEAEQRIRQLEKDAEAQRAGAEQRTAQLQKQLDAQTAQNHRFDELAEKLSGFTHQISNHFDKKLDRASQNIERTLGLNNYLQTGTLPINQPALPALSSDLGLYLAGRVETRQYDLIIEFGSGASTLFLARTVLKRLEKTRRDDTGRLSHDSGSGFDKDLAFISPDDNDLPKRLVSFEHRKDICERLEQTLQSSGLNSLVDVSHAPLVDYHTQEQDYLHYDCDAMLERIARLYEGRTARLLVLVSGPPLKAGINARFPAMPRLLNRLGTHELDVVLQGARADQAQAITTEWTKLLDQRGIACRQEPIDMETGTTLFAINQS